MRQQKSAAVAALFFSIFFVIRLFRFGGFPFRSDFGYRFSLLQKIKRQYDRRPERQAQNHRNVVTERRPTQIYHIGR